LYRLQQCPPGYEFHRDDVSPDQDQCIICPSGKYLLESSTSNKEQCIRCPVGNTSIFLRYSAIKSILYIFSQTKINHITGGICDGGDSIRAKPGYWMRKSFVEYDVPKTSKGIRSQKSIVQALIFRCQPGESITSAAFQISSVSLCNLSCCASVSIFSCWFKSF
jgi:hypothetical protein